MSSNPFLLPPLGLAAALALAAAPCAQQPAPQQPASTFRYRPGDAWVTVERTLQRETDDRIGFAIATSHTTERRCTVLAVAADGTADVLVEETTGPQQLHEYAVRGKDERAAHLQKGFDAATTVRHRVLRATFGPTRFRCAPAREEPAVFYLQELPELLAHALTLPADGAAAWRVEPAMPRLSARIDLRRDGDEVRGDVQLAIRDDRVRGGEEVACAPGSVRFALDAATGLPRHWRVELRYPRFPIDRPDVQVVTGEVVPATPLGGDELAALRADAEAFAAVHDAFFAGRFDAALAAADAFAGERPHSRLRDAVQAEVTAFRRQVPRYGQTPPELAVAQAFGANGADGADAGAPSLASLRGRVVVLDFWATWCVPCVSGMEHLIHLQQERRADGLAVLGLTRLDARQSLDDVRTFHASGYAASHGGLQLAYPLVVLQGDALHDWFGIRSIPKLVVLDRDGRIVWEQTGGGGEARLQRIVASALTQ